MNKADEIQLSAQKNGFNVSDHAALINLIWKTRKANLTGDGNKPVSGGFERQRVRSLASPPPTHPIHLGARGLQYFDEQDIALITTALSNKDHSESEATFAGSSQKLDWLDSRTVNAAVRERFKSQAAILDPWYHMRTRQKSANAFTQKFLAKYSMARLPPFRVAKRKLVRSMTRESSADWSPGSAFEPAVIPVANNRYPLRSRRNIKDLVPDRASKIIQPAEGQHSGVSQYDDIEHIEKVLRAESQMHQTQIGEQQSTSGQVQLSKTEVGPSNTPVMASKDLPQPKGLVLDAPSTITRYVINSIKQASHKSDLPDAFGKKTKTKSPSVAKTMKQVRTAIEMVAMKLADVKDIMKRTCDAHPGKMYAGDVYQKLAALSESLNESTKVTNQQMFEIENIRREVLNEK